MDAPETTYLETLSELYPTAEEAAAEIRAGIGLD